MPRHPRSDTTHAALAKCPTGIRGFDQVAFGGLPRGRPTLICGGAGTGKTLFGLEFLVRGATEFGEAGVFVTFEERPLDLAKNTASLGFDLKRLVARKKIVIDQIMIDRNQILETGEYNLDGLFIRLGAAIDAVGAKRVVLDTIESLFGALSNLGVLRAELRRLFEWLKDKGVTTLVTGERGEGSMTRHGLEEYVSDCVILLDQRVTEQVATRRLRIVKYRGSLHGTNEYPFLIDETGFFILPITTVALDYPAPRQFISTGISGLDEMMGGKGVFRASTVLVSGMAGTGKTSLAAHFVEAACRRRERCLFFCFEESPAQLVRDMGSIGIDLERSVKSGLLRFFAARPATFGLEMHISMMLKHVEELRPRVVVLDPISSFESGGTANDASLMLMRMIDLLKSRGITALLTSLTAAGEAAEQTGVGISSLIDTWVLVRNFEQGGERTRAIQVLKARGIKHSNQIRELRITDRGVSLDDIYVGPDGVLVGSARKLQEMRDRAAAVVSRQDIAQKKDELARKRKVLKARMAEIESSYQAQIHGIERAIVQEQARQHDVVAGRYVLASERQLGSPHASRNGAVR